MDPLNMDLLSYPDGNAAPSAGYQHVNDQTGNYPDGDAAPDLSLQDGNEHTESYASGNATSGSTIEDPGNYLTGNVAPVPSYQNANEGTGNHPNGNASPVLGFKIANDQSPCTVKDEPQIAGALYSPSNGDIGNMPMLTSGFQNADGPTAGTNIVHTDRTASARKGKEPQPPVIPASGNWNIPSAPLMGAGIPPNLDAYTYASSPAYGNPQARPSMDAASPSNVGTQAYANNPAYAGPQAPPSMGAAGPSNVGTQAYASNPAHANHQASSSMALASPSNAGAQEHGNSQAYANNGASAMIQAKQLESAPKPVFQGVVNPVEDILNSGEYLVISLECVTQQTINSLKLLLSQRLNSQNVYTESCRRGQINIEDGTAHWSKYIAELRGLYDNIRDCLWGCARYLVARLSIWCRDYRNVLPEPLFHRAVVALNHAKALKAEIDRFRYPETSILACANHAARDTITHGGGNRLPGSSAN